MSLTPSQQHAIEARGNVLVMAGAGTGKTSTLVERCLHCLLTEQPPVSLDEILMVTFTDAAAAEMRQRIRARLEEQLGLGGSRWQEQLALFETAHIGTLHSFCLQLVRQHFYELELDPQVAVMAEEEARLLADEVLDEVLQAHYAGRTRAAQAVQQLIQAQGGGRDRPIRVLVRRLHHYTQTRPDPAGWFSGQLERFANPTPAQWQEWLRQGLADWRAEWAPALEELSPRNELAAACATALKKIQAASSWAERAVALHDICAAARDCPHGKKTDWRKPLEGFVEDAEFLASLAPQDRAAETDGDTKTDPLAQDWGWVRSQMTTLLQLTQEFTFAFAQAKREMGLVDFHDLEQHALRLLWDPKANGPTRVARQWRAQLRFVFVDEYQDINAAQDRIIQALSRDGAQANRFLVGDVKQSIYRFRLAEPRIFQDYARAWRAGNGLAIPLRDNFRSREGVLQFINSLFGLVMRQEIGGVPYDQEAQLRFGAPEQRRALSAGASAARCVELQLRLKGEGGGQAGAEEGASEALAQVSDLAEADKEARAVALRLRELKAQRHPIWDEAARGFRAVQWGDMAVLLRAPANKAESYAKEFSRLDIPLQVARGGFYQSLEISDLLSLLQLLDNPLQDLPLLAVLHSPLVGLALDELAAIHLTVNAPFWTALVLWHDKVTVEGQGPKAETDTAGKVARFLERFAHWRRLARQVSLSRCLEAVLSETHYADWLLTQPRGEQRHANVQRLVGLARQFDQLQRQGLFRFLRFIEAQQLAETEPEVAPVSEADSVRLMSIHQSKGLEFPVVVVANLGKPFNTSDLRAEVILDEQFGLCPQIKPPHTGKRYPSLPYWLARRRQLQEMLGEELRLLYVAMTRARDLLLLSGSVSESKFNRLWKQNGAVNEAALLAARSYADWLGLWFARNAGEREDGARQGQNAVLRWSIEDDTSLIEPGAGTAPAEQPLEPSGSSDREGRARLHQRLAWVYPFEAATRKPAKASVSALRRLAAERDEEAAPLVSGQALEVRGANSEARSQDFPPALRAPGGQAGGRAALHSAADIGRAHHAFLQFVSLDLAGSLEQLKQEAQRLCQERVLSAEEIALLDFGGLAAFWKSELGKEVRAQARFVRRELNFTARFSPEELGAFTGQAPEPGLEDEFVVVQGIADLVVLRPQEIQLVDFKTDAARPDELADKLKLYEPQLKLYARALSKIYGRPVSACWLYFLACQTAVPVGTAGVEAQFGLEISAQ